MKPKIAILQPNQDTYTNPALVNLFKRLNTLDWDVRLYTVPLSKKSAFFQETSFSFPASPILRVVWGNSRNDYLKRISYLPENLRFYTNIRSKKYDLILAIDPDGLIASYELIKRNPCPLCYLSFEIFFEHELRSPRERKIKNREREASQQINWVVIQDEQRWQLLKRENKIAHDNVIYLPVAPAGPVERKKTSFLRDKFNIPSNKTIVLFSQGIGALYHKYLLYQKSVSCIKSPFGEYIWSILIL